MPFFVPIYSQVEWDHIIGDCLGSGLHHTISCAGGAGAVQS